MAISRISALLRGAFSRGVGFGIARRLFRGFSIDNISKWLLGSFTGLTELELSELIGHGREMRAAGQSLTELPPGAVLNLANIPVNPWLNPNIAEGSRSVSELVIPWRNTGTGTEGEWYHRFRFEDVISIDQVQGSIDSWVLDTNPVTVPGGLADDLGSQFLVGAFTGVGVVRVF